MPQLFTVVIAQGLYDLTGLNNALQSGLEALGARVIDALLNPLPLVSLSPDNATQKVLMRFNYANVYSDFQLLDTPRLLLGFDSLQYGPYVGAPLNVLAPNVASPPATVNIAAGAFVPIPTLAPNVAPLDACKVA